MSPLHDSQLALMEIDEKILRLLHDRVHQCMALSGGGDALAAEEEAEILAYWLEGAVGLELDEAAVEKICKLVLLLCKQTEE